MSPPISDPLKSWPRPLLVGKGGAPFLLYVVYGRFTGSLEVSETNHRSSGIIPDDLEIQGVEAEAYGDFVGGLFGRVLDQQQAEVAAQVRSAPDCMVFMGTVKDANTLDYLRDTVGFVTAALDAGGVAVLDVQTIRWFSDASWRKEVFEAGPRPLAHVAIFLSDDAADPGRRWFHTRGMRKFGRPDVSVRSVPAGQDQAVTELCHRFIDMMAKGAIVANDTPVVMAGIPAGMRAMHGGSIDDPDFNNVHIELRWPK